MRRFAQRAVGGLIAGEEATASACKRLVDLLPPGPARDCLSIQAEDEERHVRAYCGYLERIGQPAEPNERIREATDRLARWSGPPAGLFFAIHVVLEGEALGLQQDLEGDLDCPLFRSINRRVTQDEARHVAFGRIISPVAASELDDHDRRRTVEEIHAVWTDCIRALSAENFVLWRALSHFADRHWRAQLANMEQYGLSAPEAA